MIFKINIKASRSNLKNNGVDDPIKDFDNKYAIKIFTQTRRQNFWNFFTLLVRPPEVFRK